MQFMPRFSKLSAPLNKVKNKQLLVWMEELKMSFVGLKQACREVARRKYRIIDQQLLALVHKLTKFEHIPACQKIMVISNNLGVKNFKTAKLGNNSMLSRWLGVIAKFDFVVMHCQGKKLIQADMLSRLILKKTKDYIPLDDEQDDFSRGPEHGGQTMEGSQPQEKDQDDRGWEHSVF